MEDQVDKRAMERFSLELPARFTGVKNRDQETLDLLTSDICAGGAYFETDQPFPLGTQVRIDLILPLDKLKKINGKRAFIKVSGNVIRVDERGMAICFDEKYKISSIG